MVTFANCHLHSTFSDGAFSPEELVEIGHRLGHRAMILTDHDTVRGTYFMQRAARRRGMLTLLGCEFSSRGPEECEIHLLGFDFNPDNRTMNALLKDVSLRSIKTRRYLLEAGLERGTLRPGITWSDVVERYPYNDYISNGHIFRFMVELGIYKQEDYPEYFVNNFKKTPERMAEIEANCSTTLPKTDEVINAIISAEGVPVVAHLGEEPFGKLEYAEELRALGVRGFEINHPGNAPEARKYLSEFCDEYGLYKMGGTDHSATLGGADSMTKYGSAADDCGGVSEEDFMKLYNRELG